jgi:diguanylate cyclase (GGDEF)-like protein/excisionase family DNA binding protein
MRVGKANGREWLRLAEAADALGVSLNTLRRWSDSGRLTCYRSPGGHRRYRRTDIEALLSAQHGRDPRPDLETSGLGPPDGDIAASLSVIARVATEGLAVDSCRFLFAADGDGFVVAGQYPRDERPGGVPTNGWIAAEVVASGRRLLVADIEASKLVPDDAAACYRSRGEKSLLALPLPGKHRTPAVMELAAARRRAFTGANVSFAEFLAHQAAAVLGVASPSPATEQALPALLAGRPPVGQANGPREQLSLLRALAGRLCRDERILACDILRFDAAARRVVPLAGAPSGPTSAGEAASYTLDQAAIDALLSTATFARRALSDDGQSPLGLMRRRQTRAATVLLVPLRLEQDLIGFMELYTAFDGEPGPDLETLIAACGGAASLALADDDDADAPERTSHLDDLAARSAADAPFSDAGALVQATLETFAETKDVSSCVAYRLVDGVLMPTAWTPPQPEPRPLSVAEHPAASRALSGELIAIPGEGGHDDALRLLEAPGLACAVLHPLTFAQHNVGLLAVGATQPGALDRWHPAIGVVADNLATMIGSGDVIERLRRRNRDLTLVIEAGLEDTARLSTQDVFHAVVKRLSELTGSPVADIYEVDGDTLRALVSYDGGRFDEEWEGVVVPLTRYPCSQRAVATGEITVASSLDDPLLEVAGRDSLEKWGYQSQLSMPLVSGGRVLGIVELSDYVPRDFAADLELIRGLGQVAAHALENAALFEQVERRNHILNELVELGATANRSRDVDSLLRHTAERILTAVDAANCDIFQSTEDGLRCVVSYDRSGFDEHPVGSLLDEDMYPTLVKTMDAHQVLVVDGRDDPQLTERERTIYREFGFESEVCIPLVVNERLYGVIDLYDTRRRDYAEYLSFLRSVGQTLAGALENALLFAQLEQRTTVLRETVELGAIASQTHGLQELLRMIAPRLRDTVHAADCDIYALQDDQLRCLVSADLNGFDEHVVGEVLNVDRFPATALALHSGAPMIVGSLDDPRLTDFERANYAVHGFQSNVCVPLVMDDKVIGLIDLFDVRPRDYGAFIDYLRSVGRIAAGAIKNALLVSELEQRNDALAELVELGRFVAGRADLDALVRAAGPRLVALMGAAGCQLFTVEDGCLRCVLTYESGEYQDDDLGVPLDLDLFPSTRDALDRREVLVITSPRDERLSDYERELYRESGTVSEICVPLTVEDRVVGLLDVYDHRERDYSEHRDFLVTAARTLAGAFGNALLLERLGRSNDMLNLLLESGLEIGSTLDLDAVLESVARRLCAATDAPNCDIYTSQGDEFRCVVCLDHGKPDMEYAGTVYPLERSPIMQEAIAHCEPLLVTDLESDPRLTPGEREEDTRWGHRAKLELPLVSRGEVVGIASLFDDHPRSFEPLDMLQSLAQVAANALANATLFGRLDRSADRMALVADVSYELSSSLDLDEVLHSTASRLCAVADMPMCDIYILQGETLVNVVSLDGGEIDHEWQGRRFPLETWATLNNAVLSREAVIIETLDDPRLLPEERALMEAHGDTSELAIPLISKDRVIGVVELVDRRGPRTYSDGQMLTIAAVCRVAALAIDNADLVEDLQVRNRENELLNEIAGATGASLDLSVTAAAAVDRLRQLVPFDRAIVALRRDERTFDLVYASETRPARVPPTLDLPAAGELFGRLLEEKVLMLDLPADLPPGFALPGVEELGSAAVVALVKGAELVGILSLGAEDPDAFAGADRRLLARTGTHLALAIDNARMYRDIKDLHLSNLKALSSALNAKDYYTLGHAARVAAYMVLLGRELGWPTSLLGQVEEAAYLHDIGKIGVSDRVLLKPSGLNLPEWELMRQHPIFSADIIKPLFAEELVLGVRHHHERWDGGGYPDGIAGEQIPLIARAMCVADSYDAMSFRRPYRQGLSAGECAAELRSCSGEQFDPVIVKAFLRVLERLAAGRRHARQVAAEAAARIDPEDHAKLRRRGDEALPEYERIAAMFRGVRDANAPTRSITSHVREGNKTVVVVGSGESPDKPRIGDEMLSDDELVEVFAGRGLDTNVLFVDQWGVWISGTAAVHDEDGNVVAAVTADLPATEHIGEFEGLNSGVAKTLAAMLQTAAVQAGRSEIEAITDGLTGLYNHRYFHERLREEIDRCLSEDGTLSLLFCDVDNFRTFNEQHGHSAGDEALRAVARVIETAIRHVDIAARFGGEEFAVILMDTDEGGALEVAERIRSGILDTGAATHALSISIGVAACPADAMLKEELIDKADWAMYLAKRRGRDKVMSFSASHGNATPQQAASVTSSYVSAMSELVSARDAYERRRRFTVAHLAQAVGRELGLDSRTLNAMAAAPETDASPGLPEAPGKILAVAAAYQALVTERPYREHLSEAEALDELLNCPALGDDRGLAAAFARVLSGDALVR